MIPPAGVVLAAVLAVSAPAHAIPQRAPHAVVQRPAQDGIHGRASWVRASLGTAYMAARMPRGTRLTVCGPLGCFTARTTDYGPSSRIRPLRVVDLSAAYFRRVCGALSMGTCPVTVARG